MIHASLAQMRSGLSAQWRRLQGGGIGAVLVRGASAFFAIQLVGTALNFLLNVVLARMMGADPYGRYAYVLNWMLILLLPAKLGLDTAALRFVSLYAMREDWGLLAGFLRMSRRSVFVTSLLVAVTTLGVVYGLPGSESSPLRATFWAGAAMLPLHALGMLFGAFLRGLKRVVASQIPLAVLYPFVILLGVLGLRFVHPGALDAAGAMWLTVAAAGVALVFTSRNLRRALPPLIHSAPAERRVADWRAAALPMLLMSMLQISVAKAGILIVGALLGTTEAGIYSSADRLASVVQFGLIAVNAWAAPLIAELHGNGRRAELQRLLHVATRGLTAFSLPLCGALLLFGDRILALFGATFTQAYPALAILTLGQLVNALTGPVGFLMTMTGHQREATWVETFTTALHLGLTTALIPLLGMNGAAVATAIAVSVRNVSMAVLVWRRMGVRAAVV